jgi:RNA polymerase sigma-70 factor (ECF subfamily)
MGTSRILAEGELDSSARAQDAVVGESELIGRLRRGDPGAFAELFRRYKDRVYTICRRMTGSASEAEDLTQSAFVQMLEHVDSLRDVTRLKSWFDRLTVNVVLGQMRKHKRLVLLDEAQWDRTLEPEPGQAPRQTALEGLALERALAALSEGSKVVFLLHVVHGYTHEEIAQQLGCSTGTTKTQLHRARQRLLQLLG